MEAEEQHYPVYIAGTFIKTGRFLLYIFNSIFFVFGSLLFGLCMWIRFEQDMDDYVRNINFMHYWDAAIVLMFGAMVIMLAAVTGCCGAWFWYLPLLIGYGVFSVIGFAINLGGSINILMIGLDSTNAHDYIAENFLQLIYRYNIDSDARRTVDIIQEDIGCCGAISTDDFTNIHMETPNTCRDQVTGNNYGDYCSNVVSYYLELRTGWTSGIALCICFLQLFTVAFGLCLYRGIKERKAAYKEAYEEYQ